MTATLRLWLFVALVLGLTAWLSHLLPDKRQFEDKPLARLRERRPDLVFIGDSLLGSGVEPALAEQQFGGDHRVELLWNGGAESACWYLAQKNYVIASGVKPRWVCIFFNDRLLTEPAFRTAGPYRRHIESLMHADEPVYRTVLGDDAAEYSPLERWATRLYPLNARRHVHHEKIDRLALRAVRFDASAANVLRQRVNATFDLARLRSETTEPSVDVSEQEAEFDPTPGRSFLPAIVDEAKRAGISLCFVRVKRHPAADGRMPQSEPLRHYIAALRAWVESRGCRLVDCADDPSWTAEMYLNAHDDHIGPWAKNRSTALYVEKLRPVLLPVTTP
jgi:hypothetical protein